MKIDKNIYKPVVLETIVFSKTEEEVVENEIKKLLAKNVIEPVQDSEGKFVSLIFLRLKKR